VIRPLEGIPDQKAPPIVRSAVPVPLSLEFQSNKKGGHNGPPYNSKSVGPPSLAAAGSVFYPLCATEQIYSSITAGN